MTDNRVNTIEVKNLTKRYGALRAIDGISFAVRKGEVVGFLGPNGAGKSTTMRILCGLQPATSGEAYIDGIAVARDPVRAKAKIGYMPENNPLPLELRVIEYLRFRGKLKGLKGKRLKERIEEVLEICDLDKKARRKLIGNLSKGFRQRVGIADAILAEPQIVVMDEPTIGLDPHQIQGIRQLINNLRGQMTVILSSHILPEIEMCSDRVIIINHGKVVAQGTPDALREDFLPEVETEVIFQGVSELPQLVAGSLGGGVEITEQEAIEGGLTRVLVRSRREQALATEDIGDAFLKQPGTRLAGLSRREPSLERIFITATRPGWKSTQSVGEAKKREDQATAASSEAEAAAN